MSDALQPDTQVHIVRSTHHDNALSKQILISTYFKANTLRLQPRPSKSIQTYVYWTVHYLNLLTPNDHYSGRTAPLSSKCCILYIYSTNTDTEYFKHGMYSPFIPLQNAVCFIILTYLVPVSFTFYIQSVLKLKKKINSGAKRLIVE